MSDPAFIVDRGGIIPVPFSAAERVLLMTQGKNDRRNIPSIWYWRLILDDEAGGATADDDYGETTEPERRYADPIPVHIYVDWAAGTAKRGAAKNKFGGTGELKGKGPGPQVETTGTASIGFSRAEARRLGQLLGTHDDAEGLVADQVRQDNVFIPRPEDIFLARGRYYEILQLKPEWWGATDIVSRWLGTATMLRDNTTDVGLPHLPKPPSLKPPLPTGTPWVR